VTYVNLSIRFKRVRDGASGTPEGKLRWFTFEGEFDGRNKALMSAGYALYSEYPLGEVIAIFDETNRINLK
jgi:hypothetical protein